MKLSELLNEETQRDYFNRLVKTLGIKKLGTGAFATVFQHPVYHNVAVKIVTADPEYMTYIRWCQENQNNPWVPKIVGIQKSRLENDWRDNVEYNFVFFQKLRPAKRKEIMTAVKEIFDTIPIEKQEKYNLFVGDHKTFERFDGDVWGDIAKSSTDKNVVALSKKLSALNATDLHDGNVMMRDEGDKTQLVFTDPVAS